MLALPSTGDDFGQMGKNIIINLKSVIKKFIHTPVISYYVIS